MVNNKKPRSFFWQRTVPALNPSSEWQTTRNPVHSFGREPFQHSTHRVNGKYKLPRYLWPDVVALPQSRRICENKMGATIAVHKLEMGTPIPALVGDVKVDAGCTGTLARDPSTLNTEHERVLGLWEDAVRWNDDRTSHDALVCCHAHAELGVGSADGVPVWTGEGHG